MGSYASQTNEKERWQITQYVMNLKAGLKGEPLLSLEEEKMDSIHIETEKMDDQQSVHEEETHSEEEHQTNEH